MDKVTSQAWHWEARKVMEVLAVRNAMRAMGGRASPVAAKVLAKLEAQSKELSSK